MYSEIKEEFEPQFRYTDLNFTEHYLKAYGKAKNKPYDEAKELIRKILKEVLKKYSQTEPTTTVGKILRFISSIFSK